MTSAVTLYTPQDLAHPISVMGAPEISSVALRRPSEAALEARMAVARVQAAIRFATRQEAYHGKRRIR